MIKRALKIHRPQPEQAVKKRKEVKDPSVDKYCSCLLPAIKNLGINYLGGPINYCMNCEKFRH